MNEKLILTLTKLPINIEKIKSILKENPNIDLNSCDKNGKSYLHFCFDEKRCLTIGEFMIQSRTLPISFQLLQLFEEKGAKFDLSDKNNNTLLSQFLCGRNLDDSNINEAKAIIRFLLEHDSYPNRLLTHGSNYLHLVMRNYPLSQDIDLIRFFIKKGVDPKVTNKSNSTCLDAYL